MATPPTHKGGFGGLVVVRAGGRWWAGNACGKNMGFPRGHCVEDGAVEHAVAVAATAVFKLH